MEKRLNKLVFPLATAVMCAIMYCIAFHEQRNENIQLKIKLEKCNTKN